MDKRVAMEFGKRFREILILGIGRTIKQMEKDFIHGLMVKIILYYLGDTYEGDWKNCFKHGKGIDRFTNGDSYHGQYVNGKPEGLGEFKWKNGSSYKG
jgi:hypothetical protein